MPTTTLQGAAVTEDALMRDTDAASNFGTITTFLIGEEVGGANSVDRTLIQFDLTSIPSSAVVSGGTMSVYLSTNTSNNTRTLRAYRVLRNWVETEATWNSYSSGNSWDTAGCGNTTTDREATDSGNVSVGSDEPVGFVEIPMTASKIQEMINGGFTNNGYLLKVDTETNDRNIYSSSDNATGAQHPKLVVTYTSSGLDTTSKNW